MTGNPVFCGKCHTTRPPLFSVRIYTCVMCGKRRTADEYKEELAKLRASGGPKDTTVYPSNAWHPNKDSAAKAKAAAPKAKVAAPKAKAPAPEAKAPAPKANAPAPEAAAPKTPAKAAPEAVVPKAVVPKAEAPPAQATPKAAPTKAAPKVKAEPAKAAPKAKAEPAKAAPKAKAVAPKAKKADAKIVATACAWKDCENEVRPRSKYCSRQCSNKNARWRHAQRV